MNWAANYLIKQAGIGGIARRLAGGGAQPPLQPSPTQPRAVGSGPMSGAMTALQNNSQQSSPSMAARFALPAGRAAGPASANQTAAGKSNLWSPARDIVNQATVGGALYSTTKNPGKPPPGLMLGATGYQAMQGVAKKMMPDGSHIANVQQPNIKTFLPPLPAR